MLRIFSTLFSYIFRQTLHRFFTEEHAAVMEYVKQPTNDVFSLS